MFFTTCTSFIKELLFPLFCVSCGKEGERWCKICREGMVFISTPCCPVCNKNTPYGEPCTICQNTSSLDRIIAIEEYDEEKPIGKMIKEFKYHGARDIQEIWEEIFKKWLEKNKYLFREYHFALIPVPLHPRRERERGFNQAELLAQCLKKHYGDFEPISRGLKRIHYTKQQAHLSAEERRKNIQGVFKWSEENPPSQFVLLIDDVFTTGSTMQECARILKQLGSKVVYGLVLGRGKFF